MPPLKLIADTLTQAVVPAALAAAAAALLLAVALPTRVRPLAAAVALAAGFAAGNHFRGAIEYRLDSERPLAPKQLADAVAATFSGPTAEEAAPPPSSYYWLPWTGGLALLAGVAAYGVRPLIAWPVRILAVGVAAAFAVPPELRRDALWLLPAVFAAMLGEWVVLERCSAPKPRDAGEGLVGGPATAIIGVTVFAAAAAVLIHAHSARLADVAVILASALATTGLVGRQLRLETSTAAAGIAVALPTLLLSGYYETFSEVPAASFGLAATAPLSLAPLMAGRFRLFTRRTRFLTATGLLAVPLAAAVALAVHAESLSFE